MGATAAAAAAVIVRRERDVIEHFRRAGAMSPQGARSSSEIGVREEFIWHRMRELNVIREVSPGRYWFDEPAWVARIAKRRRMALTVLLVSFVALAVAVFALMATVRR